MHRQRHLFERIATLENLIAAGKAALRGKRSRLPGAGFLADFEKEVFTLHDELWAGTYRHGGYHYFTIYEPKQRVVAAAPFRDRVLHHAIVRVIEPIFERRFIGDSFACRVGKGTHAAMRRAAQFGRRFPYALKCDVRKYCPSPVRRGTRASGTHAPVRRVGCGAAIGTTTPTTCTPPTATTTTRRTRTTT